MTTPLTDAMYFLEVEVKGKHARTFLLPNVNSYECREPPATDFAFTLGPEPIRDHSGIRDRTITLSGRSGTGPFAGRNRGGADARDAAPLFVTYLRGFLEDYVSEAQTADRARGKGGVALILRAVAERDEYYVEALQPSFRHDAATSRFSWQYTLSFRAYKRAEHLDVPGFVEIPKAKAEKSLLERIFAFIGQLTGWVKSAQRTADAIILKPLRMVERLFREVLVLNAAVARLVRLPLDVVDEVLVVVAAAAAAVTGMYLALPLPGREAARSTYFDVIAYLGDVRRDSLLVLGAWRAPATTAPTEFGQPSIGVTPKQEASDTPVVEYTVRPGNTLGTIARAHGVDAAEIADINGMPDLATLADGTPLRPGVHLLVPAAKGVSVAIDQAGAARLEDLYGVDLLLSDDGDLVTSGDAPDDFVTITGPPLLHQAIRNRIRVVQGEWAVWPACGLIPTVGEPNDAMKAALLASSVRAQCLRDPRVTDVVDLAISDDGDAYAVDATIIPKTGRQIQIAVPVPA